jgi:hypothetical protein
MTGLNDGQLTDLVARVHVVCGGKFVSRGRPIALGLFRSVAMVVCLMRKNVTQDFAGAVFGVSQPTVSRRWDLLRPVIGEVLAEVVPNPREVTGGGTVLVDGTVCPAWDWCAVPDLFSAKVGYPGMNLQIAATLDGALVAVGEIPIHGARHDAYAFAASGLAEVLADYHAVADLGYVGVDGIDTVPFKKPQGGDLHPASSRSTPRSARCEPPSNTPSHTSRRGGYSAKKEAATAHHSTNTQAYSRPSSVYSLPLMNKPLDPHPRAEQRPEEGDNPPKNTHSILFARAFFTFPGVSLSPCVNRPARCE